MHEPSPTQKAYLARQKRDRRLVVSARLLVFLMFSGTMGNPGKGWLDRLFYLQQPLHDLQNLCGDGQKPLAVHSTLAPPLKETLLSFLFVRSPGILAFPFCCGDAPELAKVLEPYLVVLNSLPKSALAPLLIVWLGARHADHHCCRYVCGNLWIDSEPVYRLRRRSARKS